MINVQKFTVNPFQENSYVLSDHTGKCLIADPGFFSGTEKQKLLEFIRSENLEPVGLIATHCHFDHIMGVDFLRQQFGIPFECHQDDAFWIPMAGSQAASFGINMPEVADADRLWDSGCEIRFGDSALQVIHLPGHSPGHVVFYSEKDRFLLAGDVLFLKSIGRFDLPGGDYSRLITGIKEKLMILPPETKVWSGHGPETSVGFEKKHNPYLLY